MGRFPASWSPFQDRREPRTRQIGSVIGRGELQHVMYEQELFSSHKKSSVVEQSMTVKLTHREIQQLLSPVLSCSGLLEGACLHMLLLAQATWLQSWVTWETFACNADAS